MNSVVLTTLAQQCQKRSLILLWASMLCGCSAATFVDPTSPPNESADVGTSLAECLRGERRCISPSIAQTCSQTGEWGPQEQCETGSCLRGRCANICGDGCTPGESVCAGNGVQRCMDAGDGCGNWSESEACEPGLSCRAGRCECLTSCMVGQTLCVGDQAVRVCGESGCWSPVQSCGMGESCSNGTCQSAQMPCQDACQADQIVCVSESTFQTCEMQPNGCMDFSTANQCPQGMLCESNQGCQSAACPNEECAIGDTRCNANSIQVCEPDLRGCAVWGTRIGCGTDELCENGRCEPWCSGTCTPGERRCAAGQVIEICELQAACPTWEREQTCPNNLTCLTGGTCGECMPGQRESRSCGNCGEQNRLCDNGVWRSWSDCEAQGVCAEGAQRTCGNCGTQRCNPQCEWSACEGQGVCMAGSIDACGECGQRRCDNQCQWTEACNNGAGTEFRTCRDCGWQFCCPDGDWCGCEGHFPDNCGAAMCANTGECVL